MYNINKHKIFKDNKLNIIISIATFPCLSLQQIVLCVYIFLDYGKYVVKQLMSFYIYLLVSRYLKSYSNILVMLTGVVVNVLVDFSSSVEKTNL